MMGITNTVATLPGFIGPAIVGALTYRNVSSLKYNEWKKHYYSRSSQYRYLYLATLAARKRKNKTKINCTTSHVDSLWHFLAVLFRVWHKTNPLTKLLFRGKKQSHPINYSTRAVFNRDRVYWIKPSKWWLNKFQHKFSIFTRFTPIVQCCPH